MVKKLRTPDVETSNFVDFANMPSMEELLTGVTAAKKEFVPGTILEGKIAEKRTDGALIDIGYKAEGFVPAAEFINWESISRGDTVSVYLEESENESSMPVLSVHKANAIMAWNRITSECGEGSVVKGLMKHLGKVKTKAASFPIHFGKFIVKMLVHRFGQTV